MTVPIVVWSCYHLVFSYITLVRESQAREQLTAGIATMMSWFPGAFLLSFGWGFTFLGLYGVATWLSMLGFLKRMLENSETRKEPGGKFWESLGGFIGTSTRLFVIFLCYFTIL